MPKRFFFFKAYTHHLLACCFIFYFFIFNYSMIFITFIVVQQSSQPKSFFLMTKCAAYGGSQARDWIGAAAGTYTTAVATLDPFAHCCPGPRIKSKPLQQPGLLKSDSSLTAPQRELPKKHFETANFTPLQNLWHSYCCHLYKKWCYYYWILNDIIYLFTMFFITLFCFLFASLLFVC